MVLATVVALISSVTAWVRVQLLDTDQWVAASSDLLDQPEVQTALTDSLTEELFAVVDVRAGIASVLPGELEGLATPLAGILRTQASSAIERTLASDRFADVWAAANRRAHELIVAILRDELDGPISTADGIVTLELGDALLRAAERLGLPAVLIDRIPPDAGRVELVRSDELAGAQRAAQLADRLAWFLVAAVIGLYALAVVLAPGRRVQMLREVGLGLLIGGVVLLAARELGVHIAVSAFVQDPSNRPVGLVVGRVATSLLVWIAWTGVLAGALATLFAVLLGQSAEAVRARADVQRVAGSNLAVALLAGLAIAGLAWWNPGDAFGRPLSAAVLLVLVAVGTMALAARVRAEAGSTEAGSVMAERVDEL